MSLPCSAIIKAYVNKHGYITYPIATHLIQCSFPLHMIKKCKRKMPTAAALAASTISTLKRSKAYRKAVNNEKPGLYLNMPCSQICSHEQGKMDV